MGFRYFIEDLEEKEIVIIYGAGEYGKYIKSIIHNRIYGFIDEKRIEQIDGIRVLPVSDMINVEYTYIVAVTNPEEKRVITRRLINYGISDEKVVIPIPDSNNRFFNPNVLYYEDYFSPFLKRKLKNNTKIEKLVTLNKVSNIALIGDGEPIRLVSEKVKPYVREIKQYKLNEVEEIINEDMIIVCKVCDYLHLYEIISKKTDSPMINIMRLL